METKKLRANTLYSLKDGMHSDGSGLYLRVRNGSRSWVFRFQWSRARHDIGLGSLTDVKLADARKKAEDIRLQIRSGVHPVITKANEAAKRNDAARLASSLTMTPRRLMHDALAYHSKAAAIRNPKYVQTNVSALETHASGLLDIPLNDITPKIIARNVAPIWKKSYGPVVITLMTVIFRYARMQGIYDKPNPSVYKGTLDAFLPKRNYAPKHHKYCEWEKIPALYAKLSKEGTVAARAAMCVMLMACRANEALCRLQSELDREHRCFVLPVAKTRPNGVRLPYPRQVEALLIDQNDKWVFYNPRFKTHINRVSIGVLLEKLSADTTIHGFRSSFSTWCAETGKDKTLRELVLTHEEKGVAACYQRSDLLEKRRELLQEWADYVTSECSP